MAAKIVVLLFTVLALVAAEQTRTKKQVIVGAFEDDGSYFPGKYEGTGYPYAAYPYAAYPYAASPYYAPAPIAAHYAAAPVVAAPYAAVPFAAYRDDGSYFPGKYGPESQ